MFGYVVPILEGLAEEQRKRYQACYCGLCRTLKERYGQFARLTLSNDMAFLFLLLTSLYEPEERTGAGRCAPHPFRPRPYAQNELAAYCADMNIALAYHKGMDDWNDDKSLMGRAQAGLLKKAYLQVEERYPEKCMAIEECLQAIGSVEAEGGALPDKPMNLTAWMLGTIFRYQEDLWADTLWETGEALGRFVYFMDAYDDLASDIRRGRYNPLKEYAEQADYEAFCKDSLTLLIAEATEAFETLPLVQDVEILRNVLYAGVWTRYEARLKKQKQGKLMPKAGVRIPAAHSGAGDKEGARRATSDRVSRRETNRVPATHSGAGDKEGARRATSDRVSRRETNRVPATHSGAGDKEGGR